jgi:hypothetical protein
MKTRYKIKRAPIHATSQKEPFECCVCGKEIGSYELHLSIGCHIDCGRKLLWLDVKEEKPELNETVLVFEQCYGQKGNYYFGYEVARYVISPYDGRKKIFIKELDAKYNPESPWVFTKVTHWMRLISPEKL